MPQGGNKSRRGGAQFGTRVHGQLVEHVLAARRELHINLAPVLLSAGARDQAFLDQTIDQFDRAVMLDLQALGEIGDARRFARQACL